MFFRYKIAQLFIFLVLIMSISAHYLYAAWWERNTVPLPPGTEEIFQETRNISGSEFVLKYYASTQDAKDISDFFRLKLLALDWKENDLLSEMKQVPGLKIPDSLADVLVLNSIFEKEGETLMINFLPQGVVQDAKTRFTVARGNTEAKKAPGDQEDFIPRLLGKPKIDIAPVYPDAALIALSENPGFMRATYFIKDDIEKISEFYKDKMLNYGWSLTEEKPLKKLASGEVDLSKLCPNCPKDEKVQQAVKPVDRVMLEFNFSNKAGDFCIVALTDAGPKEVIEGVLEKTTIIMVQYEKAGK